MVGSRVKSESWRDSPRSWFMMMGAEVSSRSTRVALPSCPAVER